MPPFSAKVNMDTTKSGKVCNGTLSSFYGQTISLWGTRVTERKPNVGTTDVQTSIKLNAKWKRGMKINLIHTK